MGLAAMTIASFNDANIPQNSRAQMQGLPWKWILEKIVEHTKFNIRAAQGITRYIPDIEDRHCSSLQDRLALRYLEEIVETGLIDARAIPLVKALVREDTHHKKLLLCVQTEALLHFLRGHEEDQEKDWVGFADALDHIFSEEDVDAGLATRKAELSALVKDENRDQYCQEIFQKYPITTLRWDLLQFIKEQKTSVERPFLDELVQDLSTGVYNLSSAQNKPPSKSSEVHCDLLLGCIHAPAALSGQGHQLNFPSEQTKDIKNELQARLSSAMDGMDDANTNEVRATAEGHPTEVPIEDSDRSVGQKGKISADSSEEEMSLACRLRIMRSAKMQPNSLVNKHSKRRKMIENKSTKVRNIQSTDNGKEFSGSRAEPDKKTTSTADTWQINIDDEDGISETEVVRDIEYFELGKDGHEEICHKCKKQGKLLYCHGCPIAVHLNCIEHSIGQSNGESEWYCPICTYKRAVKAYEKARKEAFLARNHMFSFIDLRESHPACHNTCAGRDDMVCKVTGSSPLGTATYFQDSPANLLVVENVSSRGKETPSPDSRHDEGRSEQRRLNSTDSDRSTCVELHLVQSTTLQKELDGSHWPESNLQGQDGDGHDKNQNVGHVSHFDFDAHEEESGDQANPSLKRARRNIPGLRRKNLPWSKLEEDVLKEGVRRYSKGNGSWGFQWARILEYGYGKFHESRTSTDLKDKWRNLAKTLI